MKIILLLTVFFTAFSASASSCCFCIGDPDDVKITKPECKKWLKEASKNFNCAQSEIILSKDDLKYSQELSCDEVHFYGAFHGISGLYAEPFKIVSSVAKLPSVKKISYDGSTCLIFNNTDQVISEANYLAAAFPDKEIRIQGNQNIGLVQYLPIFSKPKESIESASKMNVSILQGQVQTSYDACSKPQNTCGYSKPYKDAVTDPNAKLCMQNNELVVQKCCPFKKGENGDWGIPGEDCY